MDFITKNIVITGASKGLGKELAMKLGLKKANLILVARSKDKLEMLQKEIQKQAAKSPLIVECDLSNENDIKKLVHIIKENFAHIDVLVNNAGIGIHKESEFFQDEEIKKLFKVNFYAPFYLTKSLLPLLKKSNSGYILNIGSLVSKVSFPCNSVYAATKSALNGFTQGLRLELRKYNIKVGIIHTGVINTSFQESYQKEANQMPSFLILKPEKVADSCVKMIQKQQNIKYLYKPILWIMKFKQLIYK